MVVVHVLHVGALMLFLLCVEAVLCFDKNRCFVLLDEILTVVLVYSLALYLKR